MNAKKDYFIILFCFLFSVTLTTTAELSKENRFSSYFYLLITLSFLFSLGGCFCIHIGNKRHQKTIKDRAYENHCALLENAPKKFIIDKKHTLSFYGELPPPAQEIFREALHYLSPPMLETMPIVRLAPKNHFCQGVVAHCFGYQTKTGSINNLTCFQSENLQHVYIWHEFAHAYTNLLFESFLQEWEEIAFQKIKEQKGNHFLCESKGYLWKDTRDAAPRDGFVCAYGAKDILEDIATTFEQACFLLCTFDRHYIEGESASYEFIRKNCNLAQILPHNCSPYLKKLALLQKYGFFSETTHKRIKTILRQHSCIF